MKISVCMPYWNRQAELDRSLAAYRRIYKHLDLEFSICDDGSPVPVNAPGCIVTSMPKKHIGLNPCVPFNAAVRASTGDVVVLTNPEIEHKEDVFTVMLKLLEKENDYVTVACRDVKGMWLAGPQVDYSKNGRLPVPKGAHFHFCAMMRRELWEKSGGFDEAFRNGIACDDNDLLWNMEKAGANFRLAPGLVWHYKTPHGRKGTLASNRDLLYSKWGHKFA